MRFPIHITTDMMKWQAKNWWRGNAALPVRADARAAAHLQPRLPRLLAGALQRRPEGPPVARRSASQAVDESGAPVVSICGGEPTIYPELPELIDAIIARKRHIYLCTNGILLDRFFKKGQPHKRLSINVHLDGMREDARLRRRPRRASSTRRSR